MPAQKFYADSARASSEAAVTWRGDGAEERHVVAAL